MHKSRIKKSRTDMINEQAMIIKRRSKHLHLISKPYCMSEKKIFRPFVSPETQMKEFTFKAIIMGCLMGCLFGAATVYLALKAGLTVSASIPIAVIAITIGRRFLGTTILENNIIQTTGSASESIAAGVAFTLPGFLFLSLDATGN